MSKEKALSIVLIIAVFVFAVYFGYNNYQEKKQLKKDKAELFGKIEQLNQDITRNNQIIAQREQEKAQDAMSIKQLQEQIKDALKNNQCANDFMPSNVSDWMRSGKN
jgi:Tfp pilus assembly protein PilE